MESSTRKNKSITISKEDTHIWTHLLTLQRRIRSPSCKATAENRRIPYGHHAVDFRGRNGLQSPDNTIKLISHSSVLQIYKLVRSFINKGIVNIKYNTIPFANRESYPQCYLESHKAQIVNKIRTSFPLRNS